MDTVHECDRQTDRRTDRRTDSITITKTVQRMASHGKNFSFSADIFSFPDSSEISSTLYNNNNNNNNDFNIIA